MKSNAAEPNTPAARDFEAVAFEMYEHILFLHGYLTGAIIAARRDKPTAEALAELEPLRANAARLGRLAGFPLPVYFIEAKRAGEDDDERCR